MKTGKHCIFIIICAFCVYLVPCPGFSQETRKITDGFGRTVSIPGKVDRVICSGAGCLRLLTYLNAHDRIAAVDSVELRGAPVDARPYAIANPQFRNYPLFGEFRGHDNPELIAALNPGPQVIFKIMSGAAHDPDLLQAKTGIPVIAMNYGNLTYLREDLNKTLRIMAQVTGQEKRAEEVINYFDSLENDLKQRTRDIPEDKRPSCYIGGLAQSGPHGFQSTDLSFAPFVFTHARNAAAMPVSNKSSSHASVSKEQIIFWDPEVIFLDVSTMRLGRGANALEQLKTDPAYQTLSAVRNGRVYTLFPSNSYHQNYEIIFANAYYAGKVLYPEHFSDINPMEKAEEISIFLNSAPTFEIMNKQFEGMAFAPIKIR